VLSIVPPKRVSRVISAFVQDEITLVPKTWKLTLLAGVSSIPAGRASSLSRLPG
jgi:hypothetical protein